ncbi:sensor histidine kinase [Lichenibacterium dinghuense]|uniref:sensor histidine kinase n=1 Tax=Lichenibacterium dinghuense TaxID=2895977 RepID=UPI001F270B68|nr:HAMP domain-containing sensor histidine kinase [Lichenibacterium sp. 6Y81]
MPRSLLWRLTAVLGLLLVAAVTSGFVMFSLFEQSTAARIGQASAVAGQACGAIARTYRFYTAGWSRGAPDVGDAALRRDLVAVVATALGDRPAIEGGLWQADAGALAYAYPTYEGGEPKTDVPAAEISRIRGAARAALAEDRPQVARYDAAAETLVIASCPLAGPVPALAAWTMTRVHSFAGGAYVQLMAGLGVLAASTAGACLLVAMLLATWRRHVAGIEAAFAGAGAGDLPRLAPTGERELDRIVLAMNEAGVRLERSRAEMRALSGQVAEAERLAAVGRVAAGVTHEIRNPIAAMRLKAEMALRGDERRMAKALHLVISQVDRLDLLVRRLLAVTERSCPHPVDTDLAPFLDACAAPHRRPGGPAVRVDCAVPAARLDRDQMRRALDGLLSNAVEAAGPGPVTLRAERDGERLALSVSDDGPGPPDEIRHTLFEPFVTGHPERAGLGLSIVREIARAHDGSVECRRDGGVTTFRLEVPWRAS